MRSQQVRAVAAATPQHRDRTVDLLRAVAIAMVVVGHGLVVGVCGGRPADRRRVLALLPVTQPLTWAAQVMPLFFVVGGWAGAASWRSSRRRGTPGRGLLHRRLVRLLRPTTGFLLAATGAAALARLAGADDARVRQAAWLVVVALWLLAVYVVATAAVPALVATHDRWGLGVPAALAAATAVPT